MLRYVRMLAIASIAALLLIDPLQAGSKARPFKGSVTATWDNVFNALPIPLGGNPPANFAGGGPVTHMGKTTQTGTLILGFPDAFGMFPGVGSVTITAANGDQVSFDYIGTLNSLTGEGIGDFVFTSGTGRFANVSGSGTFYALIGLNLPDNQPMTVLLDGGISY